MSRPWSAALALSLLLHPGGAGRAGDTPTPRPVYHGKTLREWARQLKDSDVRARGRAATALGLGPFGKAAVPALLGALSDKDAELRLCAVLALKRIGPGAVAAVPALVRLVREPGEIGDEAAAALGRVGLAALPALKELLGNKDAGIRRKALDALLCLGPAAAGLAPILVEMLTSDGLEAGSAEAALVAVGKAAVPALMAALQRRQGKARFRFIQSLRYFGPEAEAAVPTLTRLLQDADPGIRNDAALILGLIGPRAAAAAPALVLLLRKKEEAGAAALALGLIGEGALPPLRKALADKKVATRRRVASALEYLGPEAAPLLVKALQDRDLSVRRAAAEAVRAAQEPTFQGLSVDPGVSRRYQRITSGKGARVALPALIQAAKDEDEEVRAAAAAALVACFNLEDGRVAAALSRALSDSKRAVRKGVAQALWGQGEWAAPLLPLLVRALRDTDPEVREAAAHTLGEIADPEAVLALCTATRDPVTDVRRAAVSALLSIGWPARDVTLQSSFPAAPGAAQVPVVVPTLLGRLRDSDAFVRVSAAEGIWVIERRANEALAVLGAVLTDRDLAQSPDGPKLRVAALNALHALGSAARQAVPVVAAALQDPDQMVRECARAALDAIAPAPEESLAALKAHLRGRDLKAFERAAAVLQTRGKEGAAILARALVDLRDPDQAQVLCWSLSRAESVPAEVVPILCKLLRDRDKDVCSAAVSALGNLEHGSEQAARSLAVVLAERSRDLHTATCEALGRMGRAGRPAVPALRLALLNRDSEVRLRAAIALARVRPDAESVAALVECFQRKDGTFAGAGQDALEPLRSLGSLAQPALPAVRAAFKDPDPSVRVAAALTYWGISGRKKEALPVLEAALKGEEAAVAAALALWRVTRSRQALLRLLELMQTRGLYVPDQAAQALASGILPAKEIVPLLLPLLRHHRRDVRSSAACVLRQVAPKKAARLGLR